MHNFEMNKPASYDTPSFVKNTSKISIFLFLMGWKSAIQGGRSTRCWKLERSYPSIGAATSNLAPFPSLFLLAGCERRRSCDTHKDREWPIHETKRNERNYQRHSRLNSFSLRFHRNAYIVYISIYIEGSRNDSQINHTPEIIKTLTVSRRTKNTVASALQTF